MGQDVLQLELPLATLKATKIPHSKLAEFIKHTIAVELYREGRLSLGKARELAGLQSKWDMIRILNARGVPLDYSAEDAETNLTTLNKLLP